MNKMAEDMSFSKGHNQMETASDNSAALHVTIVQAPVSKFGLPCALFGKRDSYRFSTREIYAV